MCFPLGSVRLSLSSSLQIQSLFEMVKRRKGKGHKAQKRPSNAPRDYEPERPCERRTTSHRPPPPHRPWPKRGSSQSANLANPWLAQAASCVPALACPGRRSVAGNWLLRLALGWRQSQGCGLFPSGVELVRWACWWLAGGTVPSGANRSSCTSTGQTVMHG